MANLEKVLIGSQSENGNNKDRIMIYWKDGFYDYKVDGGTEITEQYWAELLEGQSQGMCIEENDEGYPILKEYAPTPEDIARARIDELKALLSSTDYQALKLADGAMTPEEYQPIKDQRELWRAEIDRKSVV